LEEAIINLINNQAAFQANFMTLSARTDERFSRIETELAEIRAILLRHEQIVQSLPETIRQKIGPHCGIAHGSPQPLWLSHLRGRQNYSRLATRICRTYRKICLPFLSTSSN
jgi:hypothetical protein